jgi:uncharacterized protein YndB with AHSA1/START domain
MNPALNTTSSATAVAHSKNDLVSSPVTLVEPGTVRLERLLPGPVERLWAYLTDAKKRATWFAGGEIDAQVGGRACLEFDNDKLPNDAFRPENKNAGKGKYEGAITRLEPMRLLAFSWPMGGRDTEVTFEREPRGKDVLLVIVHSRLEGRSLVTNVMGGWDVHTGILADLLNGDEPRPFWSTHAQMVKQYGAGP